MALHHNPRIVTSGLKILVDVSDPNCNTGLPIGQVPDNHRLYNLADKSYIEYLYNDQNTEPWQEFVQHKGGLVLRHTANDAGTTRYTTWRGNVASPRHNSYTFISWFKFDNVGQRSGNIYGGGFTGRTSFYMSPGGTSESDGVLLYSNVGSANGYSYNPGGGNDNQWHMRAFTVTGPDVGVQTLKYYRDGIQYGNTGYTNSSHDNPGGNGEIRWGSWTNSYGNLTGDLNGFMYYDRVLSQEEIQSIYKALKTRYQ
jgi:hypothetical protein